MSVNNSCPVSQLKFFLSLLTFSYLTASLPASAQVSSDGTVNTQVSPTGHQLVITGGIRKENNLFHSFNQFSIPNNIEAYFNNVNNIVNIINRVTGASISNIEGTIRTNGTANLFLINPNGITFGPNAQINIGGSFLASTAESIRFADGVQFSATNTQSNPLLTVSIPVGLQFGSNPGTIRINQVKNLSLTPGNTLALVGGDINFLGSGNEDEGIQITGGRIELGSVNNNSSVQIVGNKEFEIRYEGVENFKDIVLSQGVDVVNGVDSDIQLQGRRIQLLNGAQIIVETSEMGGDIIINASESVELISTKTRGFGFATGLFAQVSPGVTAIGGDILINTQQFIIRDGALISSDVLGPGQGGRVEVNASESVDIIGTGFFNPSIISSNTVSSGNGGELIVNTQKLTLQDGGQIGAATLTLPGNMPNTGQGGKIIINASDSIQIRGSGFVPSRESTLLSRISTESGFADLGFLGFTQGGNIDISTSQLILENKGVISAGSLGEGIAGNINITANSILLDNQGFITASSQGTGNAGNLIINTDQLTLNDRSQVAVRSIGTGQGGNLTLNARSISLDGKSQLTATSEPLDPETALELGLDPDLLEFDNALANAGSLTITTDNLTINNDSEVTVSSFALGNAGDINIQATDILLDNSSRLLAETASGEGGNINLDVDRFLTLRRNSSISTTAGTTGGVGNGGNIDINTLFLITVPSENSDIVANAFLGRGGNINIDAAGVFAIEERETLTPLSDITASSQFGQIGNIGINRPDVDPQRSLVRLPDEVLDTSNLIIDACRPTEALSRGEFTITGRGGLPSNPNEGVDNPTGLTELGYPNTDSSNSLPSESGASFPSEVSPNLSETNTLSLVEAQGWVVDTDGNVVLTAQAPTVTPHSPGLSPVTCYDFSFRNLSP